MLVTIWTVRLRIQHVVTKQYLPTYWKRSKRFCERYQSKVSYSCKEMPGWEGTHFSMPNVHFFWQRNVMQCLTNITTTELTTSAHIWAVHNLLQLAYYYIIYMRVKPKQKKASKRFIFYQYTDAEFASLFRCQVFLVFGHNKIVSVHSKPEQTAPS